MKSNIIAVSIFVTFFIVLIFSGLKTCGYLHHENLYEYPVCSFKDEEDSVTSMADSITSGEQLLDSYDYIIEVPSFRDSIVRRDRMQLTINGMYGTIYNGPLCPDILALNSKIFYHNTFVKVVDRDNRKSYEWISDIEEDEPIYFPSVFYSSCDAKVILVLHEYGHHSMIFKSLSEEEIYMLKLLKLGGIVGKTRMETVSYFK